jgi:glycosyltransferase involved in cell wall biosynthesis
MSTILPAPAAGNKRRAPAKSEAPMRVAVLYGIWPHYRLPVGEAMDRSTGVEYTFFSSNRRDFGIEHADTSRLRRFVTAPYGRVGKVLFQPAGIRLALSDRFDAIVYLGDPNYLSTWIGAPIARLRGKRVLFWTHGWRRSESSTLKRSVRHAFYRIAHSLLVYAERGRRIGIAQGFPADRIDVVYNSLDVDRAASVLSEIEASPGESRPQMLFADPDRPLLICTARLTHACRFDLLLEAAARLHAAGSPVNVLLVGDGPARERLAALADSLGVTAHFFGACYDEDVLGRLLYHADLTVSPGKVGLTALHSMMYGTPVITHGNLDQQMPEVEVVAVGRTGSLFRQDDAGHLAETIAAWLNGGQDRATVRETCRAVVRTKWNPETQAEIIRQALLR